MGGWMLVSPGAGLPIILNAGGEGHNLRLRDHDKCLMIPFDPYHPDAVFILDAVNNHDRLQDENTELKNINTAALNRLRHVRERYLTEMSDVDSKELELFLALPDIGGKLYADERDRLREENDRLRDAMTGIATIIEDVDQRCLAKDGPVDSTTHEMTDTEMMGIYKLAITGRNDGSDV